MSIHAAYEQTILNRNKGSIFIPRGAMIVDKGVKSKDTTVHVTI